MGTVLEISLSNALVACGLAGLAGVVGWWWRRPALTHACWLLVLLKLLTPPLWNLPVSWPQGKLSGTPASIEPATAAGESHRGEMARVTIPQEGEILTWGDADTASWPVAAMPSPEPAGSVSSAWFASFATAETGLRLFVGLWLAGSVTWFALAGYRIGRFQRLLALGRPAPDALQAQTEKLARQLGLEACPVVWLVPGRISPLLWAVGGRARLVLPSSLFEHLPAEQQATLLTHELAHARRHDHWVRWLELAAVGLYWWHPVVWWARRELHRAEEECCDAWVVWALPSAAKAYARALLQTVDFLDARPALPPVASGVGHVECLKRRLTMIVRQPIAPRLSWPAHAALVSLGLLVLPVAPQRLQATPDEERVIVRTDDDKGSDAKRTDIERRLDRLEQRLDRALQALERQQERRSSDQRTNAERAARDAARAARDAARDAEKRARANALEAQKNAEQASRNLKQGKDAKDQAEKKHRIDLKFELDGNQLDVEKLKAMEKAIEEAVHEAVNPEKMKQLEIEIQKAVNEAVNPEKMKQLEKHIQETVQKTIDPEKIERMAREIELQFDQRRDEKRAPAKPGEKVQNENRREIRVRKSEDKAKGKDAADLERRMENLERRMEKLVEQLEKSQPKQ